MNFFEKKISKMENVTENNDLKTELEDTVSSLDIPDAPYGSKISKITNDGIEFYWKKVENADGYEIFRSYDENGEFEKIGENNSKNKGVYVDDDFDYNKRTVCYKSRSYFELKEGKRSYSEFTKVATANYREELVVERDVTYMYDGTNRTLRVFYGWGEITDGKWKSINPSIVTVNSDGMISAISTGETEIICTSKVVGKSISAKVVVNRKSLEPLYTGERRYVFNKETNHWESRTINNSNNAILMMVGDLMCGAAQTRKQYTEENGYKFNDSFEYVKKTTEKSDFAIGNLETLMASGWPYMVDEVYIDNINNCNNPSRYLDAVLSGGFDAVTMSNNHNCDGGIRALLETIDEVELRKVPYTGMFRNKKASRHMIINVNGIKVGFLAYMSTYTGFNDKDATWTQEEKDTFLNVFTEEKARVDIADCRACGAEYIIVYMHWGQKNYKNITKAQKMEAQQVANAGVDYIVGANPHVLQVYDEIQADDGRIVPCFYSTGNFQAYMNQIPGNRDSIIVRIRLTKDENGKVVLKENNYIPYHTYTKYNGNYLVPLTTRKEFAEGILPKNRMEFNKRIRETIGKKVVPYGSSLKCNTLLEGVRLNDEQTKKSKKKMLLKKNEERDFSEVMVKNECDYEILPKVSTEFTKHFRETISKKFNSCGNYLKQDTILEGQKGLSNEQIKKSEKKLLLEKKRERYISAVMVKTGWDHDYTKAKIEEAKKKIGCGYYVYAYFEYYNMTDEEQLKHFEKWKKKKEAKKTARAAKRERCLAETIEATGWTREKAEEHLDEAISRTGCDPEEYRQYRFWNLDNATQESFLFLSHTDMIRNRFNVDLNLSRLIADKSASNIYFAKYIDRKWCVNKETSFEEFKDIFQNCSKVFYKPMASFGGHGAQPFDINSENLKQVYDSIVELPEGVVEEFVVQHPRLQEMSPRILNTVRLTSISSDVPIDEEGNHFVIPYAMLKMGGATGYVDNLREGGVGAAIDLENGKLCTDAVDVDLKTYTHHPVSGVKIKGFEVPYFNEAKKMIQKIVEENNMKGYLAWDVAITERGPMLIEINGRPSPTLLELPFYNTDQRGNKYKMEKYM